LIFHARVTLSCRHIGAPACTAKEIPMNLVTTQPDAMTAFFDFGAFPPEVNSAKMYTGPGSASLLSAATAWNSLATEIRSHAATYSSIVANLTGDGWQGPASTAMAAAVAPYTAWMNTIAAQAEQTATQATAAAAAYESAFGMTVPPPVIAANRAQLAALVATNVLGQNGPAIAATEALYAQMWAQDAATMYGYAAQSSVATTVPSLRNAPQTTAPAALAGQNGRRHPGDRHQHAGDVVPADRGGTQHAARDGFTGDHDVVVFGARRPGRPAHRRLVGELSARQSVEHVGTQCELLEHAHLDRCDQSAASGATGHDRRCHGLRRGRCGGGNRRGRRPFTVGDGRGSRLGYPGGARSWRSGCHRILDGAGQAGSVGTLSAPPSWTAAAPSSTAPAASAVGGNPQAAPPEVTAGVPGVAPTGAALGARAGAASGIADNRFLIRPPMVPSWAAVG
jgi:hypothetical protein